MIADKILKEAGKKFRSASWYTNYQIKKKI